MFFFSIKILNEEKFVIANRKHDNKTLLSSIYKPLAEFFFLAQLLFHSVKDQKKNETALSSQYLYNLR